MQNRPSTPMPIDFRRLFDAVPHALLVLDLDLRVVEANVAYAAILGRTREALVGREAFSLFPDNPDDPTANGVEAVRTSMEAARHTGQTQVMPVQRYDVEDADTATFDERYWSIVNVPLLDDQGATVLLLNRVEDVTAYVRNPSKLNVTHPNLTVIAGELTDREAVQRAVHGADSVISALGPSLDRKATGMPLVDGTRTIVDAMRAERVERYIGMATPSLRDPRDKRLPRIAGPCSLVLFGVTGDLATKKLMPAIYDLANRGLLPPGFSLIGFARRDWADQDFGKVVYESVKERSRTPFREDVWRSLSEGFRFVPGTFDDPKAFDLLAETVREIAPSACLTSSQIATSPKTVNQMKLKPAGANRTPSRNCRMVRPREMRAMNMPTKGDHEIHQPQ